MKADLDQSDSDDDRAPWERRTSSRSRCRMLESVLLHISLFVYIQARSDFIFTAQSAEGRKTFEAKTRRRVGYGG